MQSPQGDGNVTFSFFMIYTFFLFEKCSPRKGTETYFRSVERQLFFLFEKCSPRKGTETSRSVGFEEYFIARI